MKRNQIYIGKIKGISVGLDYSWFLVFIMVTWILAGSYFPSQFKGWSSFEYWFAGAVTSVLFFLSVLLHEISHSIVAEKYNIKVNQITLFIFGGIAEIKEEPKSSAQEFWISIAGPLMSLTIAVVSYLISRISPENSQLYAIFNYLFEINLILTLFNLVPGFPLDGGRVFRAIVWSVTKDFQRATTIAAMVGRFFGFIFILIGFFLMMKGAVIDGIWIAFIGWFLESAALAQLQKQVLYKLLSGKTVEDAMSKAFALLPANTTIQEFIDNEILLRNRRFFIVEEGGTHIGFVTIHAIKSVPKHQWETTTVKEIMTPMNEVKKTTPSEPLLDALKQMDKDGVNQLPVFDENDRIIGIISRENILSLLNTIHLNELG